MRHSCVALAAATLTLLSTSSAKADGQFDRTLTITGAADLDVRTDAGGIIVTAGSPGTVRIHVFLQAKPGWFGSARSEERIREIVRNPPIEQSGNRVRIGYVHDRSLLRDVSMRIEIQTPLDTRLHASADSGGIRVAGIRGRVECQTDSGGIDIRDIGSDVRADADSGGIHIRNVNGSVTARADSGGIEALDVAGAIEAHTDSGGIRLSQTSAAPIHAEADSGGVTATLAP